jgi:hypothetical protein
VLQRGLAQTGLGPTAKSREEGGHVGTAGWHVRGEGAPSLLWRKSVSLEMPG